MRAVRALAPLIPYIATIIGIHLRPSAWTAILLYHAGAVCCLIIARREIDPRILFAGWQRGVGIGMSVLCILVTPAIILLWPLVRLPEVDLPAGLHGLGLRGAGWILFALYYSTLHPIIEELFWRGWLGTRQTRPTWGDIAFGGYHAVVLIAFLRLPWVVVASIVLIAIAWLWRQLAARHDGLAIPVVSHIVADVGVMLAVAWLAT